MQTHAGVRGKTVGRAGGKAGITIIGMLAKITWAQGAKLGANLGSCRDTWGTPSTLTVYQIHIRICLPPGKATRPHSSRKAGALISQSGSQPASQPAMEPATARLHATHSESQPASQPASQTTNQPASQPAAGQPITQPRSHPDTHSEILVNCEKP